MAVSSEIHRKHINELCGSKVDLLMVVYKVSSSSCPSIFIRDSRQV
jgi:hypothetical protein